MSKRKWIDNRAILNFMAILTTSIPMNRMYYYSLQISIVYEHVVQAEGNLHAVGDVFICQLNVNVPVILLTKPRNRKSKTGLGIIRIFIQLR